MSDDERWTPTTEDVREAVIEAMTHPDDLDFDDAVGQQFDRWLAAHDREWKERWEATVQDADEARAEAHSEWERACLWRQKANGYAWALRSIQSEVEAWRNMGLPDDRMSAIALILDTPRPETPRVDRIERGER